MNIRFLSIAEAEFADAALYYSEASPIAAARFVEAIESATTELINAPLRYPIVEREV